MDNKNRDSAIRTYDIIILIIALSIIALCAFTDASTCVLACLAGVMIELSVVRIVLSRV